jgi:outer membrane receptor for ferric coprogen and ferric-rhodotorulic acid
VVDPATDKHEEVTVLPPFNVVGEETEGYDVSSASTATRTNEALIDIPQTVAIVTAALWRDTAATSFHEALKYAGNVYIRNRYGANVTFLSRGFTIDPQNGIATEGVRVYGYRRDLVAYERVELVKGPPSSVQGRGSNSGLVNFSYKKPSLQRTWDNFRINVGGYPSNGAAQYRLEFDNNRKLNEKGTMAVRVIGALQNSDGYQNFQEHVNTVYGLFPSFCWKPNKQTELVVNAELLATHSPYREPGQGFTVVPAVIRRIIPGINTDADPLTALNLPRSFNPGGSMEGLTENTGAFFASLVHNFNQNVSVRQVVSYYSYNHTGEWWDAAGNKPTVGADGSLTNPITWGRDTYASSALTLQGDVVGTYGFGPFRLTSMGGYAFDQADNSTASYSGTPSPARFDFKNPNYNHTITNATLLAISGNTHNDDWGFYGQQEIATLKDRLTFVGGLRRDFNHNDFTARITHYKSYYHSALNSTRYGVKIKPTKKLVLYGIRTEQNDSKQTNFRYTLAPVGDPRLNEMITYTPQTVLTEAGVKGEFFSGRLTATLAHYNIQRTGTLYSFSFSETTPSGSQIITENLISNGDTTSGWELQLMGNVTERLGFMAAVAHNSGVQPDPNNTLHGRQEILFCPHWTADFYGKYCFRNVKGNGWIVRAGGRAMGPFMANVTAVTPTSRLYLPRSQYAFDVGAGYRWKQKYEIDLQINNINDSPFLLVRAEPPRSWHLTFTGGF